MKTLNRLSSNKMSAVALLLLAGAFVAPHTASAENGARASYLSGQYREIRVEFAYYKTDPAEEIYSDFKRTAKRACTEDSIRPLSLRRMEAVCSASLMDKVVEKLGRADVAAVHQNRIPQVQVASR
jgi:hypothetical protein